MVATHSAHRAHRAHQTMTGFSLIELLIAMLLLLVVVAAMFRVVGPRQRGITVEAETADLQQRVRVAVDALSIELLMAGNGADRGDRAGSLAYFVAPVLPYRRGFRNADQPGAYKADTITIVYVNGGAAQTTIAQPMLAQSGDATVAAGPGCPATDLSCGFKVGMTALVFDDTGAFDAFAVTGVQGSLLHLEHNLADEPRSYQAGSTIVEGTTKTYYLKTDAATDTFQLIRYDGGRGADLPVVDHIVSLEFDYFGEPQPPLLRKPIEDPDGPWTTYGPKPPPAGVVAGTTYPAGENCVFTLDALSKPAPRLPTLGADPSLVHLTPALFEDGPWCPDPISPNRYDADLLRIRKVAITLRVEVSAPSLRGRGGPLFIRPGTSDGGGRMVPDQEIRWQVAPRSLNLWR